MLPTLAHQMSKPSSLSAGVQPRASKLEVITALFKSLLHRSSGAMQLPWDAGTGRWTQAAAWLVEGLLTVMGGGKRASSMT
jgi:hypothetical protein